MGLSIKSGVTNTAITRVESSRTKLKSLIVLMLPAFKLSYLYFRGNSNLLLSSMKLKIYEIELNPALAVIVI